VIFAVLIAAVFTVPWLGNALFYPWAVSLTGQPTVPGYWHGEVPYGRGDLRRVIVRLTFMAPGKSCNGRCSEIRGSAKVCKGAQPVGYEIRGKALDRSGAHLSLYLTTGSKAPGAYLSSLDAEWAGGDRIGITTTLTVTEADGSWQSDHQPTKPVRFELYRGTEADVTAAC
jgi:hypothetical protein